MTIKKITEISLLVSFITILGVWSIQVGPLRISLMLFVIALISLLFDVKTSLSAILIYYALVSLGLPFGTGFRGGVSFFLNPWIGYYIGFLLFPFIMMFGKIVSKKNILLLAFLLLGTLVVYIFGLLGLYFYGTFFGEIKYLNLAYLFSIGVAPFVVVDLIKIIIAYIIYDYIDKNNLFNWK